MATKPRKQTTPLERMTELTRRIVAVPKSEIPTHKKREIQKRGGRQAHK